ncbi:MAG TPA: hypothetical protein DCG19_08420 [Cryomorphaceae bacterium]|nr:hypothetical protein [Owenweeksia sp.]MBF99431.1 hypothetical protein [Owenweeksia sp.]HAD97418.1 hypothetical protein [Cryomorphaceae bacterium]HBF21880.1 hypothetical protein [Cryomorphaceae bacterium]|tara:strand:- start:116 stop:1000 length:885 start_codon:yes stop_codon:yes gene_type:complete
MQSIVTKLSNISLETANEPEIREYLKSIGRHPVAIHILRPGDKIIRARLNEEKPFDHISKLSYKPQIYNKEYQRASTPGRTMFYGVVFPGEDDKQAPKPRMTIVHEVSTFAREIDSVGEQQITFSVWSVKSPIELVAIIHHQYFQRPLKFAKNLLNSFYRDLEKYPEYKEIGKAIMDYLSNEYAKLPRIGHHEDYMISAIYSDLVATKYDGVLYPSMRMAGEGLNIAITPEAANGKLEFIGASECTIYKNGLRTFIGGNTEAKWQEDGKVSFGPLSRPHLSTKEEGRAIVGLRQ